MPSLTEIPKRLAVVLLNFSVRALRRLRFFPFSLGFALLGGLVKAIELWRGEKLSCTAEIDTDSAGVPRDAYVWADGISNAILPGRVFDVCLRLPATGTVTSLPDIFSMLLVAPRLRSIYVYWDEGALQEDRPLLQGRRDRDTPTVWGTLQENLKSGVNRQLHDFFSGDHRPIELPVAAIRDAHLLLKRVAQRRFVVCLSFSCEWTAFAKELVAALPEVLFVDIGLVSSLRDAHVENMLSLDGHGFVLHERLALVQAADAYVGDFDVFGCAAMTLARPAVLFGGGTDSQQDWVSRGDKGLWFPGREIQAEAGKRVVEFLQRWIEMGGDSRSTGDATMEGPQQIRSTTSSMRWRC